MLKRAYDWFRGWYATLAIKYRNPELYRELTKPLNGTDFGEVKPPVDTI